MIRLMACVLFLAGPVAGQDASEMLNAAKAQLALAQTAQDRIAALTRTVQAYEAGLSQLRQEQREFARKEAALVDQLRQQNAEIAQVVGFLASVSKTPAPVHHAHPDGPLASLRAGMLAADMVPALQERAATVRASYVSAGQASAAVAEVAQSLTEGLQGAQVARAALGQAMSERRELPARFADDPVQSALLAAAAADMNEFMQQVALARASGQGQLEPNGGLPLPVAGQVRADTRNGRNGVRIFGPAAALVTAPVAATVLFQGPLLDYGQVIVLEPAADVLFVFGGLGKVFVIAGQMIDAGDVVGLLGAPETTDDGILTGNLDLETGNAVQSLYLEVTQGQTVVSPNTWFALD